MFNIGKNITKINLRNVIELVEESKKFVEYQEASNSYSKNKEHHLKKIEQHKKSQEFYYEKIMCHTQKINYHLEKITEHAGEFTENHMKQLYKASEKKEKNKTSEKSVWASFKCCRRKKR